MQVAHLLLFILDLCQAGMTTPCNHMQRNFAVNEDRAGDMLLPCVQVHPSLTKMPGDKLSCPGQKNSTDSRQQGRQFLLINLCFRIIKGLDFCFLLPLVLLDTVEIISIIQLKPWPAGSYFSWAKHLFTASLLLENCSGSLVRASDHLLTNKGVFVLLVFPFTAKQLKYGKH